jgi:ATP-dependent helicase/nuclease subunit B
LPDCDIIKESTLSPVDRVWNTDSAKSFYSKFRFSKNADKLRDVLIAQGDNYAFLENLDIPLSQKSCTVSPEIAKNLFGNRLSLTQSRLEKYVLCGFDYYCTYVLGLRESKRAVFQLNDIGTFIHYILEMFMKEISDDGKINLSLSDAEIESILQRTVEKYLFELLGENYALSNRTKHLFDRLNKLSYMIVKNLIDEFKSSDFIPSQFELKVGMGDEGIKALEFKLKDGSTVSLRGIADRVDTYKKDDKIYIRVVDYKTGSKEFSFDDLKEGLNTQLLIYLFSICKSNDQSSKDIFGLNENDTFVPAGIQYLSSNAPVISIDSFCEKDMVDKMIQGEFSRSGILTDDPEILRAINHDLDSAIVSKFKEDSEGNLIGKSLMSNDGFEEIYSMLSETIINVAQSMKDGKANAVPLRKGEKAPCRYCKMKSVCRASVCKSKI